MEIQSQLQEWFQGDDVENRQHPPQLQPWDRTEIAMMRTVMACARRICEREEGLEKQEPPAVTGA
jgi:hypothetical protein